MKKQQVLNQKSSGSEKVLLPPVREKRYFSPDARNQIIKEVESKTHTVLQASRLYQVSCKTIYEWLSKYSTYYQKSVVKVVELESEYQKRLALETELNDYKCLLGSKQAEIEYLKKLIEIAEGEYQIDIKKNSNCVPSYGFSITKTNSKKKV